MEAIFMDSGFKNTRIIDAFSSFIWNDQYIGYGDFELRFPMVEGALGGIDLGRYLTNNESDRYMIVEGIEMRTSVEDGNTVTISGRSLESLLDRRVILEQTILTGSFQDGIFRLINASILNPTNPDRKISKIIFKWSEDPRIISEQIDLTVNKGANLYDAVYEICYDRRIGFRCIPNDKDGTISFELFMGQDRSYAQSKNPWVVFSPKFENIQETDMVINKENLRNVIYAETTYTERVEDSEGNYTEEEKTIRVEVKQDNPVGIERREMFLTTGETPQRINKSDFGTPEDRVDITRYARYEEVDFHQAEWDHDNQLYLNRIGSGDGLFNPNNLWDPRNHILPPRYQDYVEYDWVLIDEAGYRRALESAKQQIQAEYEMAMANEAKTVEDHMREEASITLSERLKISTFDGEVAPMFQYILGRDYNLGDVVQIVNEYGFQAVTRVTGILYSQEVGNGYMVRPQFESDDKAVFDL